MNLENLFERKTRRAWFVVVNDECLGPYIPETITTMLKLRRVSFADFAWYEGMDQWVRIFEFKEFEEALPGFPKFPFPNLAAFERADFRQGKILSSDGVNLIRRRERAPITGTAELAGLGTVDLINISEGGLLVSSSEVTVPKDTELKILIQSENLERSIDVTGTVVRQVISEVLQGLAIEFLNPGEEEVEVIRRYVTHKLFS